LIVPETSSKYATEIFNDYSITVCEYFRINGLLYIGFSKFCVMLVAAAQDAKIAVTKQRTGSMMDSS
jgi:hypothetical protein